MGGKVLFQDALRQRLDIMQPSQQKVEEFLAAHPPRISKGVNGVVIWHSGQ
jgi:phosphoserine phosphatase